MKEDAERVKANKTPNKSATPPRRTPGSASKKALRQKAIARAKETMKQDAAKVAAVKAKSQRS